MFGCEALSACNVCYNEKASTSKRAWLNEQHELLMTTNRQALKHIWQSAKKRQTRVGGKTLHILIGNFMLLRYHPDRQNKIQANYKYELFVIVAHHKDPDVSCNTTYKQEGTKKNSQHVTVI